MNIYSAYPIIRSMSDRDIILKWMNEILSARNWNPRGWASKAGISPTTITRFRKHSVAPLPTARTLMALARAAETTPPIVQAVEEISTVDRHLIELVIEEVEKWMQVEPLDPEDKSTLILAIHDELLDSWIKYGNPKKLDFKQFFTGPTLIWGNLLRRARVKARRG